MTPNMEEQRTLAEQQKAMEASMAEERMIAVAERRRLKEALSEQANEMEELLAVRPAAPLVPSALRSSPAPINRPFAPARFGRMPMLQMPGEAGGSLNNACRSSSIPPSARGHPMYPTAIIGGEYSPPLAERNGMGGNHMPSIFYLVGFLQAFMIH